MTTQNLTEATLVAPVFCGTDEEIAAATNSWSSVVNALSYMNSMYVGNTTVPMTPENKKALFASLLAYSQCKMDELNNVTQPPVVTPMAPSAAPAVAPEVTMAVAAPESYAEAKIAEAKQAAQAKNLQRLRELAGIPHAMNRV